MASGRSAVAMSEDEIEQFLDANMKVQVATIGPDGAPHLTTLFYVVDDGRIAFWTYGAVAEGQEPRRDPRITCLVENGDDYFELRGVSIQGRARLVEEYDDIRTIGAKVAKRMAGGVDLGELGDEIVETAGPQAGRHRRRAGQGRQLGPPQDGRSARIRAAERRR